MASAGQQSSGPAQASALPDYILRMIHGQVTAEEKHQQYDNSLASWWNEYAARKNDEEEEHVADSLLYDERCHLPRTTPRPELRSQSASQPAPASHPVSQQASGTEQATAAVQQADSTSVAPPMQPTAANQEHSSQPSTLPTTSNGIH